MDKIFIVMVGLPARGKSTLAHKLREGFEAEGIRVQLFNNGELRRLYLGPSSADPSFYHPDNAEGRKQREDLAVMNSARAVDFLQNGGQVAILDATNASAGRRARLQQELTGAPILFIECVNEDKDVLDICLECKAMLPEFSSLSHEDAVNSFRERIEYYKTIYSPVAEEKHYLRVDTLRKRILFEHRASELPYYIYIRTVVVSDLIRGLYLARHGQSEYNIDNRIGGDPPLTVHGLMQAKQLARQFDDKEFLYVFTSTRQRSVQTVGPFLERHPECIHVALPELDEIDSGVCDGMRYADIRLKMPAEYSARSKDKYNYEYPGGESYATMRERVERGMRKAFYLTGGKGEMLIIGHQAVNRTILSLFLYSQEDEVPYIYVPQNQFYYIESTYRRKAFELVRFMDPAQSKVEDNI